MSSYSHQTGPPKFHYNATMEQMYGDTYWYFFGKHGLKMMIGGIWLLLWTITILTDIRYIRCVFKIKWSKGDDLQMIDYMNTKTIVQFLIFQTLLIIKTVFWIKAPFLYDCLHWSMIEGIVILAYYIIKECYAGTCYLWRKYVKKEKAKED